MQKIPGLLVPLWKTGKIQPLACKEIVDEYIKVFAYPQFALSEEEIDYLVYNGILPCFVS